MSATHAMPASLRKLGQVRQPENQLHEAMKDIPMLEQAARSSIA